MKRTILLILTFASFYFMGCMSTSSVAVTYSFAEGDSQAATIDFQGGNPGVNFVDFDGAVLPEPEKGTYWGDIAFPAGEPIEFTVHAHYTAPAPMSSIAEGIWEEMSFKNVFDDNYLAIFIYFPVILPIRAVLTLGFYGLALFIDLPLSTGNINEKIVFECPPLEAAGTYSLKLVRKKPRKLALTNTDTGMVVYEQEF